MKKETKKGFILKVQGASKSGKVRLSQDRMKVKERTCKYQSDGGL